MKCIALAVTIVVGLMLLPSSFVLPLDHPHASSAHGMQGYLSKLPPSLRSPATPNEPISQTMTPALTPTFIGHIPVTIDLGNVSDLSFIYEGGKLAYVQFYSKDQDRVTRITYDEYRRLADMGKITYYGTFIPVDHSQAVPEVGHLNGIQEKAGGLSKHTASVQEMVTSLRDHTQSMINMVRTDVVPAVNSKIVAPLRDYTQSMINKARTAVT